MILYHGTHNGLMGTGKAHEGMCLVDCESHAARYAGRFGTVYAVDLDGMVVEECPGYDHDTNDAPADEQSFRERAADRGVDILEYEDEDEQGQPHTCYRIVSPRAIEAANATFTECD